MDDAANDLRQSLPWRVGFFLRDLLPESNLQLLFPLGSFLLLLGWQYWDWLPVRRGDDRALVADALVRFAVRFAYTASVVLWSARFRSPVRKFVSWVFLPVALGVTFFLGLIIFLPANTSVLDSELQTVRDGLAALPSQILHLGYGAYFTLAGAAVLGFSLRQAHGAHVSLPLRFRGSAGHANEVSDGSHLAHRIIKLVIVSLVVVTIIELATNYLFVGFAKPGPLPFMLRWPPKFTMWEWLNMLFEPAVVSVCAIQIFRDDQIETLPRHGSFHPREYLLAFLLPLAIVALPRFLLKIVRQFHFALSGLQGAAFPPSWGDLFAFRPVPWIFVVYLVAWIEEYVLRDCLQNRLERVLGLKRAIFLVSLIWWMLAIYNGFGPIPALRVPLPGISTLVLLAAYFAYNIPLGWLYARTRSLLAVTLMHGTMLLLRVGDYAFDIYFSHRSLYWIETTCWIFVGWYLFKKYPVERTAGSTAATPA